MTEPDTRYVRDATTGSSYAVNFSHTVNGWVLYLLTDLDTGEVIPNVTADMLVTRYREEL